MNVSWSSFIPASDVQQLVDALMARGSYRNLEEAIRTAVQNALSQPAPASSDERLRELLEGMGDAFYALDRSWRFTYINRAAEAYFGRPRGEMLGSVIWEFFPRSAGSENRARYEAVLATGQRASFEAESVGFPGRRVEFNVFRYADGLGVSFRDWTERSRAEEALRESQARLSALADNLPLGMVYQITDEPDPDKRQWLYVSGSCEQLLGISAEEACRNPDRICELVLPEFRGAMDEKARRAYRSREPFDMEVALRHALTGETRWHRIAVTPRELPEGRRVWDGLQVDITPQKQSEDHLRLLLNELNHRVKNTLATVQSMAAQSFRNVNDCVSLEAARRSFESRLFALARGHDVLTRESWEGANLAEVVQQAVQPYLDRIGSDCFRIEGPDRRVTPAMALGLSMALHELCTNALKYGSLTCPAGRVAIEWFVAGAGEERLHLVWREEGGPPVSPPQHKGFGTRLIEHGLARELNGSVQVAYEAAGVVCTIDVPLEPGAALPPGPDPRRS